MLFNAVHNSLPPNIDIDHAILRGEDHPPTCAKCVARGRISALGSLDLRYHSLRCYAAPPDVGRCEFVPPRRRVLIANQGLDVSRLPPTGTVTLLLADVEESTHLWQMCPEDMATAIAHLDHTVSEAITNHGGVQPVKRYEGDSFVAAFTRASDAAACALDLQRTSLAPIRLRIGLHTGEVQLRDELYVGPTINRTARLRDLAHGGQVVLSAATGDLVTGRSQPMHGLSISAATRCAVYLVPNGSCSCATPTFAKSFPHCARPNPARHRFSRRSSPHLWAAVRK